MSTIFAPPGPARGRPRPLATPAADAHSAPRSASRVRTVALPLFGMGAIAALVPVQELWPAQLALLALLLTVPGLALLRALAVPALAIRATPVYVPAASLALLLAAGT